MWLLNLRSSFRAPASRTPIGSGAISVSGTIHQRTVERLLRAPPAGGPTRRNRGTLTATRRVAVTRPICESHASRTDEGETMDHAVTARRMYDLISSGDIDGFGEVLADDFVEHEETPGLAPTKDGVLEFFRM